MNTAARLMVLLAAVSSLGAEPRFRADDGNLWRLNDNPALAAASGSLLALGLAKTSESDPWDLGTSDLQILSPLVSFGYVWNDEEQRYQWGTSLGLWEGVSLGYRLENKTRGSEVTVSHQFGAVYRPFDMISTAVTLDDAWGDRRLWGAGLGLRPLAWLTPQAEGLTLTADASWTGESVTWERLGGRFAWEGSDLRVWYDLQTKAPGLEVTLAWGALETSASTQRLGASLRGPFSSPEGRGLGPVIVRVQGSGELAPAPGVRSSPWTGSGGWSLPDLISLLARAETDPRVVAVAFENPPIAGGLAAASELQAAVSRLQKAGKKVYVHADAFDDSQGYQGWISYADRISLDPNGSLWLTSSGSRRLYLKDFLDKIGIRFVNLAPWDTKSANNPLVFSSMPEGERTMLQRFLTDRDDLAASALAAGRGTRLKTPAVSLVHQGPYLVAQQALDQGLVDHLENRSRFEEYLKTTHPGMDLVDNLSASSAVGWGPSLSRRTVAMVHLAGDIVMGPGEAGASIGRDAVETLETLRTDASVQAVVLRVDSPGGAVLPSDALADQVKRTVASGKPVLVIMGNRAASGGYYLSAPATRIFAHPGTLTGSIGVTAAVLSGQKALDLLGIRADGVELAPSAGFADWTRDLSAGDAQKWNAMIDATYERFLTVVADGRKIDRAQLEPLARGQIYTGREALALGLVDELGGQPEAKAWLERHLGGPISWREYVPGEVNPWGNLLSSLATAMIKASDSPSLKLAATLDGWAEPWTKTLAGIAARGPGPLVWVDLPLD